MPALLADPTARRVVLAHDYLITMGGGERVVASLHRAFPQAPIVVSATDYAALLPDFADAEIRNTPMQHLPGLPRYFKKLFPLYPWAFQSLGTLDADLAIISSAGFAKWLRFTPPTMVFCYCHTPPRYFWQTDHYLENEVSSPLVKAAAKLFIPWLRRSDYACARRIHWFIANSRCVQARIRECYGRESTVIYPPVQTDRFQVVPENDGYYLILSRLVAYKAIDCAVRAFTADGRRRLVIVGDGPDRARLQAMAGPNVEFKGRASDGEVTRYMERCYAFVFPGLEDFGITPLEAQACGKPVLAYGAGGALESILDGITGCFFPEPTPESLAGVFARFEATAWDPHRIRTHAEGFAEPLFMHRMVEFVESKLEAAE